MAIGAVVLFLAGTLSLGQNRRGEVLYGKATEATVQGTVEEVRHMVRRGFSGTHVMLKTGSETLTVHLGPAAFLAKEQLTLAKEDQIEVIGWKIKVNDTTLVIARQVRKGSTTYTLRDEQGSPRWDRGRWSRSTGG